MKKILGVIILGLLLSGNVYAKTGDTVTGNLNYQLEQGFEIIEILPVGDYNGVNFILKNQSGTIIICSVSLPQRDDVQKRGLCIKP